MNDIFLSICIPTYNRADYLNHLLDSIVCQFKDESVFRKTEVIISDNNSNDNTAAIVSHYQNRYANIKYSRNEKNVGAARNIFNVLRNPVGKYVWLIGDDDVISDGSIKRFIGIVDKSEYSVVLINYSVGEHDNPEIKSDGNFLKIKENKIYKNFYDFFKNEDFKNFYGINFMSALVYSQRLLNENFYKFDQFIDTCYLQSYIFLILGTNGNILRISDPLVTCRYFKRNRRYDKWQVDE